MDGTISVSLLALNGKPPSRIDVPSTLDVSELRAKAAALTGFPVDRTKLVYEGQPLHDTDGKVALKQGSTVLVASAPVAEVLGDSTADDDEGDFRLDGKRLNPRVLAAARALKRRGAPEWALAALLSVPTKVWVVLSCWLLLWKITISFGWGAVFFTLSGFVLILTNLGDSGSQPPAIAIWLEDGYSRWIRQGTAEERDD